MRSIAENTPDLSYFTEDDIAAAVKTGKAQDLSGLVAEHLKYAGEVLIPSLTGWLVYSHIHNSLHST